ncbi:MAG: dTDP-4-dehydrorhamnose 3,5-epimerase family protein [Endomicrobium sp.]|nr:dTDP-4-dehydrorhamnose 3,5-epimerase family protein [Endomicrobium sp.]
MKFVKLPIEGAFIIETEENKDERGSFSRQFCKKELFDCGLDFDIKQCNISKNYKKGVLRGMHYQKEPYSEIKIVSCFQGSFFDVIVDLRRTSPTYLKWCGVQLSAQNNKMTYIPKNCAHGFETLQDNTIIYYQVSQDFMPDYYAGIRYNDPKLGIQWLLPEPHIMNARDANYPLI